MTRNGLIDLFGALVCFELFLAMLIYILLNETQESFTFSVWLIHLGIYFFIVSLTYLSLDLAKDREEANAK